MPSTTTPEIDVIQRYIAYGSVGASTVRGLGQKGIVVAAREALRKVNLKAYGTESENKFRKTLDIDTKKIRCSLPNSAQHWGVARKVLNIFLRGALYNTYLNAHFELSRMESWYEIPLDKLSAEGIRDLVEKGSCPRWDGVKYVTEDINERFQNLASEIATARKIHRVHLDAIFWGGR